jgi:hypothetical protein
MDHTSCHQLDVVSKPYCSKCGHGASTACGEGARTEVLTASANRPPFLSAVIRAMRRSPGTARSHMSTKPLPGSLHMPRPPNASEVHSTSTSSPTAGGGGDGGDEDEEGAGAAVAAAVDQPRGRRRRLINFSACEDDHRRATDARDAGDAPGAPGVRAAKGAVEDAIDEEKARSRDNCNNVVVILLTLLKGIQRRGLPATDIRAPQALLHVHPYFLSSLLQRRSLVVVGCPRARAM